MTAGKRSGSRLRALGFQLLLLVASLLAAEGLLRIYLAVVPTSPDSPYIRDAHAAYRLRADTPEIRASHPEDHINTLGFRDREHDLVKPEGKLRVLGIGDSFVYGNVPLEHNYLRVAERRIAERAGSDSLRAEMVLAGIGGYGPDNYVGVLRSVGLDLSPDLVVMSFFVGNDVIGLSAPGVLFRGRVYYAGSYTTWLNFLRKSRLFLLAESVVLSRAKREILKRQFPDEKQTASGDAGDPESRTEPSTGSEETATAETGVSPTYLRIQVKRLPVFLKEQPGKMERLWRDAESYLLEFDEVCREAGVPWVLHIIPSEIQVDATVRGRVLDGLGLSDDLYDFDAPQRRLHAFAEEHGFDVNDPLEALRTEHLDEDRLYIHNDTHWNVRGNLIAGEMLGDHLAAILERRDSSR